MARENIPDIFALRSPRPQAQKEAPQRRPSAGYSAALPQRFLRNHSTSGSKTCPSPTRFQPTSSPTVELLAEPAAQGMSKGLAGYEENRKLVVRAVLGESGGENKIGIFFGTHTFAPHLSL